MNQDHDPTAEAEYRTAIAAAAFAVKSLEDESGARDQRSQRQGPDESSTRFKIKPDDAAHAAQPRTRSIKFSDEVSKPNLDAPQDKIIQASTETSEKPPDKAPGLVPAIKKKLSFADAMPAPQPEPAPAQRAEEPIGMIPSVKKPPTLNRDFSKRQEKESEPSIDAPPLKEPPFPPANARPQISKKPRTGETEADEWERAEMSRIKEKYEKLNATINDWESKRRQKAKRRLDKVQVQAETEKKRAKAVQHYHSEVARIHSIAEGARSQAIKNRKREEVKVREKANNIRLTGKLPATCLCC